MTCIIYSTNASLDLGQVAVTVDQLVVCLQWNQLTMAIVVQQILLSCLLSRGLRILPSPKDGHCLLYSLCNSWSAQLPQYPPINLERIRSDISLKLYRMQTNISLLHQGAAPPVYSVGYNSICSTTITTKDLVI